MPNEGLETVGLIVPPDEQIMCCGGVWCANLGWCEQQRITRGRWEAKEIQERVPRARGCGQPGQCDVQLAERLNLRLWKPRLTIARKIVWCDSDVLQCISSRCRASQHGVPAHHFAHETVRRARLCGTLAEPEW